MLFSYGGKRVKKKENKTKERLILIIAGVVDLLSRKKLITRAGAASIAISVMVCFIASGISFDDTKPAQDQEKELIDKTIEIITELPKYEASLFIDSQKEAEIVVGHIESSLVLFSAAPKNEENVHILEKAELTNSEKEALILEKYNLTLEQFDIILGIVIAEAKPNSYADAYAVINTVYNRTKSIRWSTYIDGITGAGAGTNLYLQMISEGQFEAYLNDNYLEFVGNRELPAYQAVIDFLTSEEIMHNFMSFYASFGETKGSQPFISWGNIYHDELTEDDLLENTANRDNVDEVLKRVLVK